MPINHDRLFKELLTTFFDDFVALLLPEVSQWLAPGSVTFFGQGSFH
ncbi:hypothetical protein [Methylocucumis oryzae]|nr:hypothetical protein [Methylocucumis oryzae]